ncbi:MAG: hypothetical protein AB2L26_01695 [Ignavibacteria bacterium]
MNEKDIIVYAFRHMINKDFAMFFFREFGIEIKNTDSYEKISNLAENYLGTKAIQNISGCASDKAEKRVLDLKEVTRQIRTHWNCAPIDFHIENLKSGKLAGHGWYGAMPSTLHLSLQNKVRECISGSITFDKLLEIGSDIMKHEYFMVATHDILESAVINNFSDVIPSIGYKSISDFIYKGIPFDLKNTNFPAGWNKNERDEEELIKNLVLGADSDRMRKQAEKSYKGNGLNRFFVIIENQERWLKEPDTILDEFIVKITNEFQIYEIGFDKYTIYAAVIII